MIKLTKGESVKILSPESTLVPLLKAEGWVVEGEKQVAEEDRDALMEKAKELGLTPHHKAGVEKLKEMIAGVE